MVVLTDLVGLKKSRAISDSIASILAAVAMATERADSRTASCVPVSGKVGPSGDGCASGRSVVFVVFLVEAGA